MTRSFAKAGLVSRLCAVEYVALGQYWILRTLAFLRAAVFLIAAQIGSKVGGAFA